MNVHAVVPVAPKSQPTHIIEDQSSVTDVVIGALQSTANPRLREVIELFIRHMHAFAREARLSDEEFEIGVDFLNHIGQASHDAHNEAILFSDVIGFSTLLCLLNNGKAGATETASALLGPFWRGNQPRTENGGSIVRSPTPGAPLFVNCRIIDPAGKPMASVEVDVWHASPIGLYENQDITQADMNLRGKLFTDTNGRFSFRTVKPAGYPVPTEGPVGAMLRAQGRHPYRPAHLHFLCYKSGYKTLITQLFVDDDERLESDVVFGVTRELIGEFRRGKDTPPASDVTGEWYRLDHDFVMEPGEAKLPKPPIK